MRVVRPAATAIVFVTVLAPAAALSQQATTHREEAVDAFAKGRAHYKRGEYAEAAKELERAHALDPDSATLKYNLARVYELMGEFDRAIAYYLSYASKLESDSKERLEIEATIERLRGAAARQAAHEPEPPKTASSKSADAEEEPTAKARSQPPLSLQPSEEEEAGSLFPVVLVSGGGALVAAGALSWLLARSAESEANELTMDPNRTAYQERVNRAETFALLGDIAIITGIAAASIGVVVLLSADGGGSDEGDLRVWAAPLEHGAALGVGGQL